MPILLKNIFYIQYNFHTRSPNHVFLKRVEMVTQYEFWKLFGVILTAAEFVDGGALSCDNDTNEIPDNLLWEGK